MTYKKPTKCVKELYSSDQQHAKHAPAVQQAGLSDGQARCQRRPRREHRRDVLPPTAGASDRVGPWREASSAAGQHKGGHDIQGRLQQGPWLAGHVGADRARGQDRRRLAGAALTGAHSSRQKTAGQRRRRSCTPWTTR